MDAEFALEKLRQDVANGNKDIVYLKAADAKSIIKKINALEFFLAQALKSGHATEAKSETNLITV